jgi:hypothetical protein
MDSDDDVRMSDSLPALSKGKGKAVDTDSDAESLPWWELTSSASSPSDIFRVEKYRPVTLDDVVSHKDITSTSKLWFWFSSVSLNKRLFKSKGLLRGIVYLTFYSTDLLELEKRPLSLQ